MDGLLKNIENWFADDSKSRKLGNGGKAHGKQGKSGFPDEDRQWMGECFKSLGESLSEKFHETDSKLVTLSDAQSKQSNEIQTMKDSIEKLEAQNGALKSSMEAIDIQNCNNKLIELEKEMQALKDAVKNAGPVAPNGTDAGRYSQNQSSSYNGTLFVMGNLGRDTPSNELEARARDVNWPEVTRKICFICGRHLPLEVSSISSSEM